MIWSWTSDSWRFCGQWFSLSSKTSYSAAENDFVPEQVTAEEPVANDTVYPTRQNPSCSAAGMSSSVITGTFFSVKFIHFWHFLFVNLYSQVILSLSGPRGFIWQLMFFTLTYNCVISLSNVFIVSCTVLSPGSFKTGGTEGPAKWSTLCSWKSSCWSAEANDCICLLRNQGPMIVSTLQVRTPHSLLLRGSHL